MPSYRFMPLHFLRHFRLLLLRYVMIFVLIFFLLFRLLIFDFLIFATLIFSAFRHSLCRIECRADARFSAAVSCYDGAAFAD